MVTTPPRAGAETNGAISLIPKSQLAMKWAKEWDRGRICSTIKDHRRLYKQESRPSLTKKSRDEIIAFLVKLNNSLNSSNT